MTDNPEDDGTTEYINCRSKNRLLPFFEEREMIIIRAALLTQCTNIQALLDLVNDMMHGEPA